MLEGNRWTGAMRDVFLVDPLADTRLFAALTGGGVPETVVRATLPGHDIVATRDGLGLASARRKQGAAPGVVLPLGRAARERLDFWMNAIGAAPLVARVDCAGERRVVDTHVLPGAEARRPWTRDGWEGEWHDLVCEAAEEVGRLRAVRDAKDMPALMTGIGYRALGRARGRVTERAERLRTPRGRSDVILGGQDPVYANYFAVDEFTLRFRRYDGSFSVPVNRAVFGSGDAVMLLPYDAARDLVLLVEQFRSGPYARGEANPWSLEAVAGRCDPMESPETTARREAREEAALSIGRIERIASYYPSIGMLSEYVTAFVGEADLSGAGGEFGLESEDEDIRGIVAPLGEALGAVRSGEINNAPTILALMWLEREAARLREAWAAP